MAAPAWLPACIPIAAYGGDWELYLEIIYDEFRNGFIGENLTFQGKTVGMKRHPEYDGREATFWHLISEGPVEAERIPNLRRCECIGWPRAILDNADDPCLKIWRETDRRGTRIYILCEDPGYVLVLAERSTFVLPWTGFPVEHAHQVRKYLRRWEEAHR